MDDISDLISPSPKGKPKRFAPQPAVEVLPAVEDRRYVNIGPGRVIKELRAMVLDALDHEGGVDYLRHLARTEPRAFAALLARILPMQVTGNNGDPIQIERIVREIVAPPIKPNE